MSNHTPGPWTIESGVSDRVYLIDARKRGAVGEIVYAHARNPADARLIAAAPDMLAALEDTLATWDSGSQAFPIAMIRAAIARATGDA